MGEVEEVENEVAEGIGIGGEGKIGAETTEDGELVVITNQVLAEKGGDCIKDFCAGCFGRAVSCGFQVFHGFISRINQQSAVSSQHSAFSKTTLNCQDSAGLADLPPTGWDSWTIS